MRLGWHLSVKDLNQKAAGSILLQKSSWKPGTKWHEGALRVLALESSRPAPALCFLEP